MLKCLLKERQPFMARKISRGLEQKLHILLKISKKNYTIDENVIQYTNDNVPICGTQYW